MKKKDSISLIRFLQGAIFIVGIATVAHYLFSSLGFNPSDDGFVLSGAKRVLLGEVPHRDFIIIRPMLPYFLHIPEVLWGGEYTYWVSRFIVWLQFSIIAWFSVLIAEKLLKTQFSFGKKVVFASLAFMYDAHNFPLMVWYSIDAVSISVIGIWLVLSEKPLIKYLGYVIVGLSPLTRQNFLLLAPALLFILGDFKKMKYWIASFLPLFAMGVYLLFFGALNDAIVQMTAQTDLLSTGFIKYYRTKAFIRGIVVGIVGVYFFLCHVKVSFLKNHQTFQELIGRCILFFGIFVAAKSMVYPDNYIDIGSYLVFGMVFGIACFMFLEAPGYKTYIKTSGVFLVLAWSVSVSLGYNTPALATAGCLIFLLVLITKETKHLFLDRLQFATICILTIPVFFIFKNVRENQIYREQVAHNLTYPLDGIFPGGNNIKTNHHTFIFLADLKKAKEIVGERKYIILPDLAGYWATANQPNPLPLDWPSPSELNTKSLMDRALSALLQKQRNGVVVILQKYNAAHVQDEFIPINRTETPLIVYVTTKMRKIGETDYYEVYE